MLKKTMKNYITGIKPICMKNTITTFSKKKQSSIRKLQLQLSSDHNIKKFSLSEHLTSYYQTSADFEQSKKTSSNYLNRKAKRKFIIEKTIDLHGLTKIEAFEAIMKFFENCRSKNIRRVLLITGGSAQRNSIIRSSFIKWMDEYFREYVSSYTTARSLHGGEGAFYIILKINK